MSATGCGGSDHPTPNRQSTAPAATEPPDITATEATPAPTTASPSPTITTPQNAPQAPGEGDGNSGGGGNGGTPAPSPGGGGGSKPQGQRVPHDNPPPPGSPEQRYEEYCNNNPGACD